MKLRSIGESEDDNTTLKKLTDDRVKIRKLKYLEDEDTTNEELGAMRISLDDYDDSEVSTTTEILSNVASRVKTRFVDLVEGDNPEEDSHSISSSDVVSGDESMESVNKPVQVTPIRPSG